MGNETFNFECYGEFLLFVFPWLPANFGFLLFDIHNYSSQLLFLQSSNTTSDPEKGANWKIENYFNPTDSVKPSQSNGGDKSDTESKAANQEREEMYADVWMGDEQTGTASLSLQL